MYIAPDLHNFVASYHPLSLSFLAAHFILIVDAPRSAFRFFFISELLSIARAAQRSFVALKGITFFPDLHRASSGGKYILLCSVESAEYFDQ